MNNKFGWKQIVYGLVIFFALGYGIPQLLKDYYQSGKKNIASYCESKFNSKRKELDELALAGMQVPDDKTYEASFDLKKRKISAQGDANEFFSAIKKDEKEIVQLLFSADISRLKFTGTPKTLSFLFDIYTEETNQAWICYIPNFDSTANLTKIQLANFKDPNAHTHWIKPIEKNWYIVSKPK